MLAEVVCPKLGRSSTEEGFPKSGETTQDAKSFKKRLTFRATKYTIVLGYKRRCKNA
jgi:hypothetical protein